MDQAQPFVAQAGGSQSLDSTNGVTTYAKLFIDKIMMKQAL